MSNPTQIQGPEYLSHLIPLSPGADGQTTCTLNAFAKEGWELVGSHVMIAQQSLLSPEKSGLALFIILRRDLRQEASPLPPQDEGKAQMAEKIPAPPPASPSATLSQESPWKEDHVQGSFGKYYRWVHQVTGEVRHQKSRPEPDKESTLRQALLQIACMPVSGCDAAALMNETAKRALEVAGVA